MLVKDKCPYCHVDRYNQTEAIYDNYPDALYIYPSGMVEMDCDDGDMDGEQSATFTSSGTIKFCPMCGRKLMTEDDN